VFALRSNSARRSQQQIAVLNAMVDPNVSELSTCKFDYGKTTSHAVRGDPVVARRSRREQTARLDGVAEACISGGRGRRPDRVGGVSGCRLLRLVRRDSASGDSD
jgi:hypothetical protein